MLYLSSALTVLMAVALGVIVTRMKAQAGELAGRLHVRQNELGAARWQIQEVSAQLDQAIATSSELRGSLDQAIATSSELRGSLDQATQEAKKTAGCLGAQQEEMDWLRAELEKRPKVIRKTYKILTLGVKWTGKTSLTLKWANPLTDLGAIQGTKIERYQRPVSQAVLQGVTTEHVFEIGDWGGEHIIDAQQELIVEEIHGMLIVVDLGGKDARSVEPARIQEQLREFQPESLRFFFSPKTVAACKTVVLFINKSDLLPGTPAEVEAQAKELYGSLIESLLKYQAQVDIRVFVGSASYGHSTHLLFSHFVEKILPRNAYDAWLVQGPKGETGLNGSRSGRAKSPPASAGA